MSNIFNNLTKITGFEIIQSNPRSGRFSNEPHDGNINYNGKLYYFKFSHEFDDGNTYIVYENNVPVFYFMLYNDPDTLYGPLIFEEK